VSYQPEERYWTDYLRIALPVVGLLLMLGLFWYWASNVIGDSGNSNKPSPTAQVAIINAQTPTVTNTPVVDVNAQANLTPTTAPPNNGGPASEATSTTGGNAASNNSGANSSNSSDTGNAADTGNTTANSGNSSDTGNSSGSTENPSKFNKGDTVVTNDSVNMRSDHTTAADVVEPLDPGVQLNVIGDAGVKDGDYVWIQVEDPSSGSSGWVADQFVDASS
jgi:hypothetical protein